MEFKVNILILVFVFQAFTWSIHGARKRPQRPRDPRADFEKKRPVLIFPGLASNNLYQSAPIRSCLTQERVWFNPRISLNDKCWQNVTKLKYNSDTNTVEDNLVPIKLQRGNEWTGITSIEDLNEREPWYFGQGALYEPMLKAIESKGYKRREDIFGIPMDWRRSVRNYLYLPGLAGVSVGGKSHHKQIKVTMKDAAPCEYFFSPFSGKHDMGLDYYNHVIATLESAVFLSSKPAIIICHSYGCINVAKLIDIFKAKRLNPSLHKIIMLGTPWNGSTKALKTLLSGDNLDIKIILKNEFVNPVTKTFTSLVHLIPTEEVRHRFEPVVTVEGVKYKNMSALLDKFKIDPKIMNRRSDIGTMISYFNTLDESVRIFCFWGKGISTISRLNYRTYKRGFWDTNWPIIEEKDDGDGTVPVSSLSACTQVRNVTAFDFPMMGHQEMLKHKQILEFIINALD